MSVLLPLVLGCSPFSEPPVDYNDIQGAWAVDYKKIRVYTSARTVITPDSIQQTAYNPATFKYDTTWRHWYDTTVAYDSIAPAWKEFWEFDGAGVRGYVEEYLFDKNGIAYAYRFTTRWLGDVYYVSDVDDVQVVSIKWNMVSSTGYAFDNCRLWHMALHDLHGDTLEIGFCDNETCSTGEISNGSIVRVYDLDVRKTTWNYY